MKTKNKIQHQQLQIAKKQELILRDSNDGEMWTNTCEETQQGDIYVAEDNEIAQLIKKHFEDMTGKPANECILTKNFSRWTNAVQCYWFEKCGEDFDKVKNKMGELPCLQVKPESEDR